MFHRENPPAIPFKRYQCDRTFKIKIVLYKKVKYLHACPKVFYVNIAFCKVKALNV